MLKTILLLNVYDTMGRVFKKLKNKHHFALKDGVD